MAVDSVRANQTGRQAVPGAMVAPAAASDNAAPASSSAPSGSGASPARPASSESALGFVGDVFVGAADGVGNMVGGLANMVLHPIETIKGLVMLPITLVTKPGEVIGAFTEPYTEAVAEGRPGKAIGMGLVDIGTLFFGPQLFAKAAEAVSGAARAGEVAGAAAKAADVAKAADAAKAGAVVTKVADAARAGSAGGDITIEIGDAGNEAERAAKAAKAAEAAKAAQAAEAAKAAQAAEAAKAAQAADAAKAAQAADAAKAAKAAEAAKVAKAAAGASRAGQADTEITIEIGAGDAGDATRAAKVAEATRAAKTAKVASEAPVAQVGKMADEGSSYVMRESRTEEISQEIKTTEIPGQGTLREFKLHYRSVREVHFEPVAAPSADAGEVSSPFASAAEKMRVKAARLSSMGHPADAKELESFATKLDKSGQMYAQGQKAQALDAFQQAYQAQGTQAALAESKTAEEVWAAFGKSGNAGRVASAARLGRVAGAATVAGIQPAASLGQTASSILAILFARP